MKVHGIDFEENKPKIIKNILIHSFIYSVSDYLHKEAAKTLYKDIFYLRESSKRILQKDKTPQEHYSPQTTFLYT